MAETTITTRARYQGCLLGGAVGDALGAPIEFMTLDEIRKRYGTNGLTDYATYHGRIGSITDDTQMCLFTAEGLLRAHVRYKMQGLCSVEECVNHAYLRWLLTQQHQSGCNEVGTDGWLFQVKELHATRAPGKTCLSALSAKTSINDLFANNNNSKGNGGVMRTAPVALMFCGGSLEENIPIAFELAGNIARLTHGHPCSTLASGAMAVLVLQLVAGRSLREALTVVDAMFAASFEAFDIPGLEVRQALVDAKVYAASRTIEPDEAITRIGEGWTAEQALGIAVYCCLRCPTLKQALVLAVNHSGDSDSTGSIAGQLAGAMYGVAAIPQSWLERLELREVIQEIADALHDCGSWKLSPDKSAPEAEAILKKYPGW